MRLWPSPIKQCRHEARERAELGHAVRLLIGVSQSLLSRCRCGLEQISWFWFRDSLRNRPARWRCGIVSLRPDGRETWARLPGVDRPLVFAAGCGLRLRPKNVFVCVCSQQGVHGGRGTRTEMATPVALDRWLRSWLSCADLPPYLSTYLSLCPLSMLSDSHPRYRVLLLLRCVIYRPLARRGAQKPALARAMSSFSSY